MTPPLPTAPLARITRTPGTFTESTSWSLAGGPAMARVLATSMLPTAFPRVRFWASPAVPVTTSSSSFTTISVSLISIAGPFTAVSAVAAW